MAAGSGAHSLTRNPCPAMATWNNATWNSGILWGPASPPALIPNPKHHKPTKMKRQAYFPAAQAAHPEWFNNLADHIDDYSAIHGLAAADVTELKEDCRYCAHAAGTWITEARNFGPSSTAALEVLYTGSSAGDYILPGFLPPALPAGVSAVAAGALDRIFRKVQDIKNAPGFNEALGLALGIIGQTATTPPELPVFSLKALMGGPCECVRVEFKKYGRMGVTIEGRRGTGPWESLAIATDSPWLDDRPLLVATQPEVREYRLRFWDKGVPTGDWTDVARITVSPA